VTGTDGADEPLQIDTSAAHAARVYDYLLGGVDNFDIDKEAAHHAAAAHPGGIVTSRALVRGNRDFLVRAVRFLAGEAGIRQFLDIGTGIPNADNVHAVAQQVAPDSRVVCVDNDPVVLAHAHTLFESTPQGDASFVNGDLRDTEGILRQAATTLDLSQPVAILLVAVLHLIRDEEDPYAIPRRLLEAVAPGSYLVVSHLTGELYPQMTDVARRYEETMQEPLVLRTHDQVVRFFDGLELVEPGVVAVDRWRPDASPSGSSASSGSSSAQQMAHYGGVARKP
jgi:hypothetical protein